MSPKLASKAITLSESEETQLASLYEDAGAWTLTEAENAIGACRVAEFLHLEILGQQDTELGPMLHLLAAGRQAVLGKAGEARSLASQLDRAYLRLSLAQLGWRLLTPDDPFSLNLTAFALNYNLSEVFRKGEVFLVGGKLSEGGYSATAIRKMGRRLRSLALYHHFRIVLLTPSKQRGQRAVKEFNTFLELCTVLPEQQEAGFSKVRRFRPVQRSTEQILDDGPVLTSVQAQRSYGTVPELTLSILQRSRRQRIQLAQLALECDGVMTGQQLQRNYGLQVNDLPRYLHTTTLLRPQAKADAVEVPTQLLIASKRMTKLSDARLLHLINLAELRHNAGIVPDSARWIVTPKSELNYEQPDAIYTTASGDQVAAESDIGHYSLSRIATKLETFRDRGFTSILYGVPSSLRCRKLRQHFLEVSLLNVIETRWWIDPQM